MGHTLAFGCVLLWKSALCKFRIVLLMPLHQLQTGYACDSNSHMKMSKQWHKRAKFDSDCSIRVAMSIFLLYMCVIIMLDTLLLF